MWESSDESDEPRKKSTIHQFKTADKSKTVPSNVNKEQPCSPSKQTLSGKQTSKACPGNSTDDSVDSDSSREGVKSLRTPMQKSHSVHTETPKAQTKPVSQAGKPRPVEKASKGTKDAGGRVSATTSFDLPPSSSSKGDKQYSLFKKAQPDVRPKVRSDMTKHAGGSYYEQCTKSQTQDFVMEDYSSEYPSLGSSSSKTKAASGYKQPLARQQPSASNIRHKGKPRSVEVFELEAKISDSDRGLSYSKCREKLSLNDFVPKSLQNKKKKSKNTFQKWEPGIHTVQGYEFLDDIDDGALVCNAKERQKKRPIAYPMSSHTQSDKSNYSSKSATALSSAPRTGLRSSIHYNSSDTEDDSGDESLEKLMSSISQYVIPQRRRKDSERRSESGLIDGSGAPSGHEVDRHAHSAGVWPRGQKPPGRTMGKKVENQDRTRRETDVRDQSNKENWRNSGSPRDNNGNRNNGRDQNIRDNIRGRDRGREGPGQNVDEPRVHHVLPPQPVNREGEVCRDAQNPHHGPNNRQHNRQPGGLRHLEANLSFTRLRELKTKPPAEVVSALYYSKEGLSRLLKNEEKLATDIPLMNLLLTSLAKTCQCQSMPSQRSEILNIVRSCEYLNILAKFLPLGSMAAPVSDLPTMLGGVADLLIALLTLFPSVFQSCIMIHGFLDMAKKQYQTRGGGELPDDIVLKLEELDNAKDAAMDRLQRKQARESGLVDEDSLKPPDDFREISVFPTLEDLNKEELPFLRKNKEVGGYSSVDHYLDVQFRLLREDFVYPLREGIAQYLAMLAAPHGRKRLKDIRVYHEVHILRAVCLPSGLGHRLTFDVSRMRRVRWEVSKRLIFGSLVCLSADNFRTLYFATVSNRDANDLREGIVDVTFEHDLEEVSRITPETMLIMAETTAFFEAYRHVLSGLQNIHGNQLPFQKYIVKCEKNVSEPMYLNDSNTQPKYDLRPLVDNSVKLREDQKLLKQGREVSYTFSEESKPAEMVPIQEKELWPDPKLMGLDESQFEAVHRALTKEFSVIQGPPGTGKTYVGLKIVKALLHNRKWWDEDHSSCMLIVCFTNHALDQFLEGVISFYKGRVVRVGSRLRSEKLEAYSLNNLRWSMRRNREDADRDFRHITRLRFQGHEAMENLRKDVDTMGLKIESARREVLHEDVLQRYMDDKHYSEFLYQRAILEKQMQMYFRQQGKTKQKVFCMPEWLGVGTLQYGADVSDDLMQALDQGLGEDDMQIEGEIQALEDQNRLDVDDTGGGDASEKDKKERAKKKALEAERKSYLAVDITRLDRLADAAEKKGDKGEAGGFQIPRAQWKKLKRKLRRNLECEDMMSEEEEVLVPYLWGMNLADRWRLYRRWTHRLQEDLRREMAERERLYDVMARRHQETLMQEDKHILKTASIIAMTTTAAARYQSVLQEVKPKVIVVEEAAEVLEGHVITTLSQDCEHLILIGDHKQLRPNPTVFALARKYNLELSLFERMINNGLKCHTLGWQHRMRPEIAALVKPIYPALHNHPTVEQYEDIKGVSSNVFFIRHNEPELHDEETKSHSNVYEAQYIARLCCYLLKQGYHSSRITVLTTYSGQLYQLRRLMPKKSIFEGVRVTVVDNFQGEENDIILISLVRSNEEGNIGFLKIENRVCVALSRAKMGLYVIGNFHVLNSASSLWQSITGRLEREGQIGEALSLYCQNHPEDQGLVIRTIEDFNRAPEGGCMKPCSARLNCGHVCMAMCHPIDKEHLEYQCMKPCERTMDCEFKHPCSKRCWEECGKCMARVERKLPKCGHTQWMECHKDPLEVDCVEDCTYQMLCGHRCGDKCGQRHRCFDKVMHTWPCGHSAETYCDGRDTAPCPAKCEGKLSCGHGCNGTCSVCHGGRLHVRCSDRCNRILVCGHACRDSCSNCPPCNHQCENKCVHSACRKRCGLPCTPCKEPCAWQCPHYSCSKTCSEPCDRPRCNEPCPNLLKCNHPCIGLCGEPCPTLCRECNRKEVTHILFGSEEDPDARFVQLQDCMHVLEVSGLDQWMETKTDKHEDDIRLKACPYCNTAIRRNLRYGAIIKTQLKDIETIKIKVLGDEDKRNDIQVELELMVEDETDDTYVTKKQTVQEAGDWETLVGLVAMQNQMNLLEETKKLRLTSKKKCQHSAAYFNALEKFEEWICVARPLMSESETSDAQTELLRLRHWLALLLYKTNAGARGIQLPGRAADPMNDMILTMKAGRPYTESDKQTTLDILHMLEELVPDSNLGVSDKERLMIVKAMALSQGHWFKCPQGHIYAIADCGGATEESRCPDCNSTIGGRQHHLRDDNALASEMDGATAPAWPTALEHQLGIPDLQDLF